MYLKTVGGKIEYNKGDFIITTIDPSSLDDQPFIDDLKGELLDTLSDNGQGLINKYAGIYFTGYDDIDTQILEAIEDIENNNHEQIVKLVLILKKIILKKFPLMGINLSSSSKGHLKSVLLTAVNHYSMEELETILSFDNITFDILDNLNGLDRNEYVDVEDIMKILKDDIGTKFFFTGLSKDNLKNVSTNISYLKEKGPDKLHVIKSDYILNTCHIKNGKGCMTDLLLLTNNVFKLVVTQLESMDVNMMSIVFSGYRFYQLYFERVWKENLSEDEIAQEMSKISRRICGEWMVFWMDKGLPKDMLSTSENIGCMTYEECSYIYDNITQDPGQLIELFSKDYNTILFIYNNITKDLNEILDIYCYIRGEKIEDIKVIYKEINDYEKFKRILKAFEEDEITGHEVPLIAFFCKYFKSEVEDRLDNRVESKLFKLEFTYPDNIKFFYEKGLCTTIDDFLAIRDSKILLANMEIIRYLYDNGICTSMDDFLVMMDGGLLGVDIDKLKFLFERGMCVSIDDLIALKEIIIFLYEDTLNILNNLRKHKEKYEQRLDLFKKVSNGTYSKDDKNTIIRKIALLDINMAEKYVKICEAFDKSNSFDIQAVKDCLIMDILNSDNPEDIVKKVDKIFLESDLPIISKIFQVFKYVYNEDTLNGRLNDDSSPYLQSCVTYEKKLEVIYKDLMNIVIKSGESSLKEFIQSIISSKQVLYDFENGKTINNDGYNQVFSLMKKIASLNLIINGHGEKEDLEFDENIDNLKIYYDNLKKTLLIKDNESIYNFFLNLGKKIGYGSLEDIIAEMNESQLDAHNNGLNLINTKLQGESESYLSNNYFLKGISSSSVGEILNRGVTSTEYLGGGEGSSDKITSNGTPFDTDGVMVKGEKIFDVAKSHGYGDIDIIVDVDKKGFFNKNGLQGYDSRIYEVFKNNAGNSDYYGVRTGIASTDFDAIIMREDSINLEKLGNIKYSIAKNGYYLPVFDISGTLLFTPQEYHILRQGFSFSDKYKGCDVGQKEGIYVPVNQNHEINRGDEDFYKFVQEQRKGEKLDTNIDNETMAKIIFNKIKDILESELGIKCNQNKNLLGAELYDSGSTGRGTEIPSHDIDLDFTLLLNSEDYERIDEIQKVIHEKIGTVESTDHTTVDGGGLQIKSSINNLGKEYGYEKGIRFDLLILKKTKSYLYPSNLAMQDRLSKIEQLYRNDTLDFVIENIVIMKKLLKSQGIYKNIEGGMGGIGVENWIMQHHGNFLEALEFFENVAYEGKYGENKRNISFEEFKNLYAIWDSGQNFKDGNNDNYILKMNESGYNGILNIIKKYRTEGLDGIIQLIHEYEQKKAEFLG